MEKLSKKMENKLCETSSFLTQLSFKFEMISDEIDNESLKNAFCEISSLTNQYAIELNDKLKSLLIIPSGVFINDLEEEISPKSKTAIFKEKGKEIFSICENCETFFTQLYSNLLSEYFTDASLKILFNYQLLGIKFAFMRIRFLNSIRFDNVITS